MYNNDTFFIAYAALWWKSMIFIVLSSFETVHDTVQYRYCILSLLSCLLRVRLKCRDSLLSYIWEREKVHFIITLFNVGNVLLCIIYQLNFTLFMYVTWISRMYCSVLSPVSHNCGRSCNILPVDKGSACMYLSSKDIYWPLRHVISVLLPIKCHTFCNFTCFWFK